MNTLVRPQLNIDGTTLAITASIVKALLTFKGNKPDEVGSVNRHKGRFSTPQAVKKEVTNYGAIRVAALNITNVHREAGTMIGKVSLVAFIMTNDHFGHHRDERAEVIASKVALEISSADWTKRMGRAAYNRPENVNMQNLCTEALDDIGVSIWSVSWTQHCNFSVPVDLSGLDDFLSVQLDTKNNPPLSASILLRSDEEIMQ